MAASATTAAPIAASPAVAAECGPCNASAEGPEVQLDAPLMVSFEHPSETDDLKSELMEQFLGESFPAETGDGMRHRQGVLRELERILQDWTTKVGVEQGLPEAEARRSTANIMTLGSYKLGVVHPGSDIDTLCLAPPHISRDDFFTKFAEVLGWHQDVTECVPIPDAYTPIIKMKMADVCIDLLFARLQTAPGPGDNLEEFVNNDDVLRKMDERCVRCINGVRVANQILRLVPNRETFRTTVRFVKYWARRRGIYSNVVGYFGGITWSLLVARVCQLYPNCSPSMLVERFFRLYKDWDWSKPVNLCEVVDKEGDPDLEGLKAWNPEANETDRLHLMPVLTPAFPSMNSTHNVTHTTKRIMLDEMHRAYEVVVKIGLDDITWDSVCESFSFFSTFENFLCVEASAKTEDTFTKWRGFVESRMRILTMALETVPGTSVHPNPITYDAPGDDKEWPHGCGFFTAVRFVEVTVEEDECEPGGPIDLRVALQNFVSSIDAWQQEKEKEDGEPPYRLKMTRCSRQNLPQYVVSQCGDLELVVVEVEDAEVDEAPGEAEDVDESANEGDEVTGHPMESDEADDQENERGESESQEGPESDAEPPAKRARSEGSQKS